MRTFIYARVSSDDQVDGYSLAQQIEACQNFAVAREWEVVEVFVEEGESAYRDGLKRPRLKEMFGRVQRDGVERIVVWKFSRYARNRMEHDMLDAVLANHGALCVSVTEYVEDSAAGRLLKGVISSINQFTSEQNGETIAANIRRRVEAGGYSNLAPIGYRNIRLDPQPGQRRGEARIVPDADQALLVREAFELYASGEWSVRSLLEEMSRRGLRNKRGNLLPPDTLHHMLRNPAYIGLIPYHGEVFDGNHESLVERRVWERVQERLDLHHAGGNRSWKHSHPLKGLLWCVCKSRLWYQIAHGRSDQYGYFYCSARCGEPYVPAPFVEEQVLSIYDQIGLPATLKVEIRRKLEEEIIERETGRASKVEWLSRRLEKLAGERDKLMDAYYAEAIGVDILKREQERIRAETTNMEYQLEVATADLREATSILELAMDLLDAMSETYLGASDEVRGEFNRALFERITLSRESVQEVTLNEPFPVAA